MVMHPMDTGLADGIPRFIIEHVDVRDATDDRLLAKMELHEPVSENPFISLDLKHAQNGYKLYLRDEGGTQMEGVAVSSASPLKTASTE
jgi:sulfur-oxidizing protein SoxY